MILGVGPHYQDPVSSKSSPKDGQGTITNNLAMLRPFATPPPPPNESGYASLSPKMRDSGVFSIIATKILSIFYTFYDF